MNDIEFALSVTPKLGILYRDGKSISSEMPCHALSFFRGLASTFCDMLDKEFDKKINLAFKIKSLRGRDLINKKTEGHLHILKNYGNIAAHPEEFPHEEHDFSGLAKQAEKSSLHLIELAYSLLHPNARMPSYEISESKINLKELSYRAVFEEEEEPQYTIGIYFKEKADKIRKGEHQFRVDNGYGFASHRHIEQANHWFKLSADKGNSNAMYEYGAYMARLKGKESINLNARCEGEFYIKRASEYGHIEATAFLGDCYYRGSENHEINLDYARELYEEAASHSHPGALAQLGEMYKKGMGGKIDVEAAFRCSLQAAEAGFPKAQFDVYKMHSEGYIDLYDNQAALQWLTEAANQKYPEATYELARLASKRLAPNLNEADAISLYKEYIKTENANPEATYELAFILTRRPENDENLNYAFNLAINCIDRLKNEKGSNELIEKFKKLGSYAWQKMQDNMMKKIMEISPKAAEFLQMPNRKPAIDKSLQVGRNDPCPCESGKKYKKCCGQ